jgi:hypothetical protein
MPVRLGSDKNGRYARWGTSGKKYYYVSGNKRSRQIAKDKATAQGKAIYSSGYR